MSFFRLGNKANTWLTNLTSLGIGTRANLRKAQANVPRSSEASILRKPLVYGILIIGVAGLSYGYYSSKNPPKKLPFSPEKKNIVVLGTGWGAISFLEELKNEDYNVTVISPRDHFVYKQLLPSYTTGIVSLASVLVKLNSIIANKKREVRYMKAYCSEIFPDKKVISVEPVDSSGNILSSVSVKYDYLVISTGTNHGFFNIEGLQSNGIPVVEPLHSRAIKDRIDSCVSIASIRNMPADEVRRLLSVVVIGGGPTGVEMASLIGKYIKSEIRKYHPHLDKKYSITIVESSSRILPTLDNACSIAAEKQLNKDNVKIISNVHVTSVNEKEVTAINPDKSLMSIPSGVIISATGISPNPLVHNLVQKTNNAAQYSDYGLVIDDRLKVVGIDDVYAIGDIALSKYPKTAQVATQQAEYLASVFEKMTIINKQKDNISNKGLSQDDILKKMIPPFSFINRGYIISMGPSSAIFQSNNNSVISNSLIYYLWFINTLINIKTWPSKISFITDTIRYMFIDTNLP